MTKLKSVSTLIIALATAVVGLAMTAPPGNAEPGKAGGSCVFGDADYIFLGSRGSGEAQGSDGLGATVRAGYARLRDSATASGSIVESWGNPYPASGVAPFSTVDNTIRGVTKALHFGVGYDRSVADGTRQLVSEMEYVASNCAGRIILGGYSQGAEVTRNAVDRVSAAARSAVAGVLAIGDPFFNGHDSARFGTADPNHNGVFGPKPVWSTSLSAPVVTLCNDGDVICNVSKKGILDAYWRDIVYVVERNGVAMHSNYGRADDWAWIAAAKLARALGFSVPPGGRQTDTVFVIDSTGSMGGEIETVEDNVVELARTIQRNSTSFRFALVDYKDDPENGSDYQAELRVPFTSNVTSFEAGVREIDADGGGDYPESMYSGMMTGLNLRFRSGATKRSLIVIGDAPGKDPEPVTGYTRAQVLAKAASVSVTPSGERTSRRSASDDDAGGSVQVYGVSVGGESETTDFMNGVVEETGGRTVETDGLGSFAEKLDDLVDDATSAPIADVSGPTEAYAGENVAFSASGSVEGSAAITRYEWTVLDAGGEVFGSQETSEPTLERAFAEVGDYEVQVRVVAADGLAAVATTPVSVQPVPSAAPSVPTDVRAVSGDGEINLSWSNSDDQVDYYEVESASRGTLGALGVDDTRGRTEFFDQDLENGVEQSYRVRAINETGASGWSDYVRATPTGGWGGGGGGTTAPVITDPPTISGASKVGSMLRADPGRWDQSDLDFRYQWLRDGSAIAGETDATYEVEPADVGHKISFRVTASKGSGNPGEATADPVAIALGDAARATRAPSFTGDAKVGGTLVGDEGEWDAPGLSYAFQWLRDGHPIADATDRRLTLTTSDAGKAVSLRVTASRDGYEDGAAESGSAVVSSASAPTVTVPPSVTATPRVGQVVKADPGEWSAQGLTFEYQWLRDGQAIQGATEDEYLVAGADVGHELSVVVTASSPGQGDGTATSSPMKVKKAKSEVEATAKRSTISDCQRAKIVVKIAPLDVTGMISIKDGRREVASAALRGGDRGKVVFTVARLDVGRHQLHVRYSGDDVTTRGSTRITVRVRG